MATLKLTDGIVEAAVPAQADTYLWDTALPRFGVRITRAGARIYLVQYRAKTGAAGPTRTRRITIGRHDGKMWTTTKARAAARVLLAPVDLGGDPFGAREEERAAAAAARQAAEKAAVARIREQEDRQRNSFDAVTERFIDLCLRKNRSGGETARLLRHGPVAEWKTRHIADIRRSDVADLLDRLKKRSPAVSRLTYAALRSLFGWCVERDLIIASPCDRLTAPPRPEARDRVLTDEELGVVWKAAERLGYPFGPAIQLLMLTGQRRAEVGDMKWEELDLESGQWRIPKERTKNGKAHEVDLSPQALAILRKLHRTGPFVFPGRRAPARKTSAPPPDAPGGIRGFSASKRKLDELAEQVRKDLKLNPGLEWRIHDLRRTAATGMAGLGFPPHVIERVLNHISGSQSGLVGVYQRHEYRPERKAALVAWGDHLAGLIADKPAAETPPAFNVIQLKVF